MGGVDLNGTQGSDGTSQIQQTIRKGAGDSIAAYVAEHGDKSSDELQDIVKTIARAGSTPLVVAETQSGSNGAAEKARVLGVIELKDIVKGGMRERFDQLRRMGIRTIMITGDNPLTAAAIAKEAGVDDFLAQATPETKMKLIREQQTGGRMVAMTGDGTNDAPALAQADVGVAMNTGTQAAKEAANSAVFSAVIFNALIIVVLIPLALRGVKYRPIGAGALLRWNLLIYGLGGIIVPFFGIKSIDLILQVLHLTL